MMTWKFRVHVLGVNFSPFVATYSIRKVASDNRMNASTCTKESIKKTMYVDDLLKILDNVAEMKDLIHEITALFCDSGFLLTKWVSNCSEVLENAPSDQQSIAVREFTSSSATDSVPQKAMSLVWNTNTDNLSVVPLSLVAANTKLGVLETLNSFIDPISFSSAAALIGRLIYQDICATENLVWDDFLPRTLSHKWNYWLTSLAAVTEIKIPRWFMSHTQNSTVELYVACDASSRAYGAFIC